MADPAAPLGFALGAAARKLAKFYARARTDTDRRIVSVWLTDTGRRLRTALEPEIARWEAIIGETLAEQHTPAEIAAFRAVLFTLIATFPDGDDLWAARSARWDKRLDTLKALLEAESAEGAPE